MNNIAQTRNASHAIRAQRHNRHANMVRWIRKMHGWIGLWGALLGLLFGTSGIWLNHRAVLKLPPLAQQRSNLQIALPDPPPENAQALGRWLQNTLQLNEAPAVRVEPARPVAWAERNPASPAGQPALMQPEHWTFRFGGPQSIVVADMWAGNRSVSVHRSDNGLLNTLMNLHKGVGMTAAWILLVDTLAGSIIFLSISGVILWVETSRRKMVGAIIFALSATTILSLALSRL